MISCVIAISKYVEPFAIILSAANCPAEVRFVADIKTASIGDTPAFFAAMPKVKETARYPKNIGIPSLMPFFHNENLLI